MGWNVDELSTELLGDVLEGGASIAAEGGFIVAGGHTVDDPEPKYGMAVVGEVHPDRMLTNAGFRPGDLLVLTKPLGIGIITTAIKGQVAPAAVADAAVALMTRLNDVAARVAVEGGSHGATDVTGFGLLGHLGRAMQESGTDVVVAAADVPIVDGAAALAADGVVPGGTGRNLAYVEPQLDRGDHDELTVTLLADAQTSGGLIFGLAPDRVEGALAELAATGHTAAVIGEITAGSGRLLLR